MSFYYTNLKVGDKFKVPTDAFDLTYVRARGGFYIVAKTGGTTGALNRVGDPGFPVKDGLTEVELVLDPDTGAVTDQKMAPLHPLESYHKLTSLEMKLLIALKQAHKYISYVEAFRMKAIPRVDMDRVFQRWQENRPSSIGIGIGATYLNDAEFNFEEAEKLIAEGERLHGGPVALPEIWA